MIVAAERNCYKVLKWYLTNSLDKTRGIHTFQSDQYLITLLDCSESLKLPWEKNQLSQLLLYSVFDEIMSCLTNALNQFDIFQALWKKQSDAENEKALLQTSVCPDIPFIVKMYQLNNPAILAFLR